MKILVTGASGFLGSWLLPHLDNQGHDVGCLQRRSSVARPAYSGAQFWYIDDDGSGVREALAEFVPDVVVHLASRFIAEHAYEDITPLVRSNIEFGCQLLEAMKLARVNALVCAGTSWQHYGNQQYCPANLYAATKQAFTTLADYYRETAGLRLLDLHLYDSYGEHDPRGKLLGALEDAALSARELAMSSGEQRLHLVHAEDLCRGFASACEQVRELPPGQQRIYRLPSAAPVSLRQLVAAFNAANPARPVRVRWGARPYRRREVFEPWDGAEVLPGWQPSITLEAGLRRLRQYSLSKRKD